MDPTEDDVKEDTWRKILDRIEADQAREELEFILLIDRITVPWSKDVQ